MTKIGTIDLTEGMVDVTDPCYDKDNDYRTTKKVKPGKYLVLLEKDGNGVNQSLSILHEDHCLEEDLIDAGECAEIAVDSGLAGFFPNKPDYTDEQWNDLCNTVFSRGNFASYKDGVVCSSGYGDGLYTVSESCNYDDEVAKLTIWF